MKFRFTALITACLLIAFMNSCSKVSSSNYGIVEGIVSDASHAPLPGVVVQISDKTYTSDATGYYSIHIFEETSQILTAAKTGYDPYSHSVAVGNGKSVAHNFQMDTAVPPQVSSTNPANAAGNAALNQRISAAFSKKMDATSISATSFTIVRADTNSPVIGTITCNGTTATFAPVNNLTAGVLYRATITAEAKDFGGNPLLRNYSWTFTTGAVSDTTAPAISSTNLTTPASSVTGIAVNTEIVATFSETMDADTLTTTTFIVKDGNNNPVTGTVAYNGTTATFIPDNNLSPDTTYSATITTTAQDSAGNALPSAYTTVFTTGSTEDMTPPTISSTMGGSFDVAPNAAVTATFSEPMDPSSLSTAVFTLKDSADNEVSGTVTYSGTTAVFIPTTPLADNTIYEATLSTTARDNAGNSLASDYTWSFITGQTPDTTPPAISSTVPAGNAQNVSLNAGIIATFSEAMAAASINTTTFTVKDSGGKPISGSVTYSGTTAYFLPSDYLLYGTIYTAVLSKNMTDNAGNNLVADHTWQFTTGQAPDTTRPAVLVESPAENAVAVDVSAPITVTFSEPMYAGSINSATFMVKDSANSIVAGNVTYSGTTAVFTPLGDLDFTSPYHAEISTAAQDSSGNTLAASFRWSFTTGADTRPPKAPTAVIATAGNGQNVITWNAVNTATSYTLYRSIASGTTGSMIATVTGLSYTDTGLTNKTPYFYLITATNQNGEGLASNQVSATPDDAPPAPIGVNTLGGYQQTTLTWTAVTNASSYNLYWSNSPGVTKNNGTKITGISSPYLHSNLNSSATYYYVVTALNRYGESKVSSEVSVKPDGNLTAWTISINPFSSTTAKIHGLAADATGLYSVGYDTNPGQGNSEWRMEKRNLTDGQTATGFGSGTGAIAYNRSATADMLQAVAADSTSLYVVGYDSFPGVANSEWRIEKRSKTTGTPVTSPLFGTSGVVVDNPGNLSDIPYAITLDSTALYVVGMESVSTSNTEWRIVKRSLANGSLINAFGTNGVVTSTTGSNTNEARAVVLDPAGSALYVVGFESTTATDAQWRIEKRTASDGQLVAAFGTNGVVTGGPGKAFAAAVDSLGLYVAGYDSSISTADTQWKIVKYDLANGLPVAAFGTNGAVTTNPGASEDMINALTIDSTGLYAAGSDSAPGSGNSEWRVEKRDPATGALMTSFATYGVMTQNPGAENDGVTAAVLTDTSLFVAGYDSSPGAGKTEWRIEKMPK